MQAGIIFVIVIAVTFGRIYAKRKQHRALQQRIDLERQEQVRTRHTSWCFLYADVYSLAQTRRGEAAGLPTYIDHGATQAIPMPTLPYPEAAYRPEGIRGDPNLPTYEPEPPKYEYGHAPGPASSAVPAAAVATQTAAPEMQEAPRQAGQMHLVTTPAASPSIERRDPVQSLAPASSAAPATSPTGEMETVPLGDGTTASESDSRQQRA